MTNPVSGCILGAMPYNVAVIGAGVIGLTSAIELLRGGHDVTIFAREHPENTTSAVPAALWFPYHAKPEVDVIKWALATRERLRELKDDPATGVRWVDFTRAWVDQPPPVESWTKPEDVEWLKRSELPAGFNFGYRVAVPLMENPTYMRYLVDRFSALPGKLVLVDLTSLDEVPDEYPVVVNCTGYGAKALCNDRELRPGRGVVVLADPISREHHFVRDEYAHNLMYVLSRAQDCVLGGCDEPSELLASSLDEAYRIIGRCSVLDGCSDIRIKTVEVGIRPIRDAGVRLQTEIINRRLFVHNYGHGGCGFTLSWGCAEVVAHWVA